LQNIIAQHTFALTENYSPTTHQNMNKTERTCHSRMLLSGIQIDWLEVLV